MSFMAAPYMVASFYWHDIPEHISLQHVSAYLMERSMTTLECGDDAEPNDALLRLLINPNSGISEIKFITSDRLPPQGKQSRRPPGRIIVNYDYISDEATVHGDHRSIDIEWSAAPVSGPGWSLSKKEAEQLAQFTRRDYYFFIDACTQLNPLYANLGGESYGLIPCMYDYIYMQSHAGWRSNGPCYLRDGILSEEEAPVFLRHFVHVEKLPSGTLFTNDPWMRQQKKHPTGRDLSPKTGRHSVRDILIPILRRFRRSQI